MTTAPIPAWMASRVPIQSVPQPRHGGGTATVTWTARCPHGQDAEWMAVRTDTRVRVFCQCDCPDTGVVIPLPEETA